MIIIIIIIILYLFIYLFTAGIMIAIKANQSILFSYLGR